MSFARYFVLSVITNYLICSMIFMCHRVGLKNCTFAGPGSVDCVVQSTIGIARYFSHLDISDWQKLVTF